MVLLVIKLTGIVDLSWAVVTAPYWIPLIFVAVVYTSMIVYEYFFRLMIWMVETMIKVPEVDH